VEDPRITNAQSKDHSIQTAPSFSHNWGQAWNTGIALARRAGRPVLWTIGVFLGVFIILAIGFPFWPPSDQVSDEPNAGVQFLRAADKAYEEGDYSEAVAQYEALLRRFPSHASASYARCRAALANLRQAMTLSTNETTTLESLEKELNGIRQESGFSHVKCDDVCLFWELADMLADSARKEERVREKKRLVDFTDKVVTTARQCEAAGPQDKFAEYDDRITGNLKAARQALNNPPRLQNAISEMRRAVEKKDTERAFRIRRELLHSQYHASPPAGAEANPKFIQNPELIQMTKEIISCEVSKVEIDTHEYEVANSERPSSGIRRVSLLLMRQTRPVTNDENFVCFLIRGTIYCLNASNGELLWQRYVGSQTSIRPRRLPQDSPHLIAVDSRYHDLMCLDGKTGRLVWRLPLDEPFFDPVIHDGRLLVATRKSRRLLDVDVETGKPNQCRQLPVNPAGPPVAGSQERLYLVGERSFVYVLHAQTLNCLDACYLGHGTETHFLPPVVFSGHLHIHINAGTPPQLHDQT